MLKHKEFCSMFTCSRGDENDAAVDASQIVALLLLLTWDWPWVTTRLVEQARVSSAVRAMLVMVTQPQLMRSDESSPHSWTGADTQQQPFSTLIISHFNTTLLNFYHFLSLPLHQPHSANTKQSMIPPLRQTRLELDLVKIFKNILWYLILMILVNGRELLGGRMVVVPLIEKSSPRPVESKTLNLRIEWFRTDWTDKTWTWILTITVQQRK